MPTVNTEEMANILRNLRGATPVTLETQTEPELLASTRVLEPDLFGGLIVRNIPNPFRGQVVKVAVVNGIINFYYENSVNNQRVREELPDDFVAFPRKWGQRIAGTPLVEHNDKTYLELKVERSLGHEYRHRDTGQVIPKELIRPFLKPRYPSRQGVEKEIILRDYALPNILKIRMKNEEYTTI